MKDAIIAKLCAQCAEYYSDTAKLMQKERVGTLVSPSYQSLVSTGFLTRTLRGNHHCRNARTVFQVVGKQQIFQGLAEYYQSLVCKSAKEIGQEIARLQVSNYPRTVRKLMKDGFSNTVGALTCVGCYFVH
jgi:programmed cell death 6-interacting protein